MAILNGKYLKEGEVPTATNLNLPYVEAAGLTVQNDNLAANSLIKKHWSPTADLTQIESYSRQANKVVADQFSTTSTSWTNVVIDGGTILVNYNETPSVDALLRIHFDVLIGELTFNDTGASATYEDNAYAFKVVVQLSGGSTLDTCFGFYSFSARSGDTDTSAINTDPINWRSCAGTQCVVIPSGTQIQSLTLQAIVGNSSNTLVVDRANLNAILVYN